MRCFSCISFPFSTFQAQEWSHALTAAWTISNFHQSSCQMNSVGSFYTNTNLCIPKKKVSYMWENCVCLSNLDLIVKKTRWYMMSVLFEVCKQKFVNIAIQETFSLTLYYDSPRSCMLLQPSVHLNKVWKNFSKLAQTQPNIKPNLG